MRLFNLINLNTDFSVVEEPVVPEAEEISLKDAGPSPTIITTPTTPTTTSPSPNLTPRPLQSSPSQPSLRHSISLTGSLIPPPHPATNAIPKLKQIVALYRHALQVR